MQIYCCGCRKNVEARLTNGLEVYSNIEPLRTIPFWKCDGCGNFVGCHYKSKSKKTQPLGSIPTKELREARKHIHALLDPIWRTGLATRKEVYAYLSEQLGKEYHTGDLSTLEEARDVYRLIKRFKTMKISEREQ